MVSIVHRFTMKILIFCLIVIQSVSVYAQKDTKQRSDSLKVAQKKEKSKKKEGNYFNPSFLRYADYIYKESVTSVQFHRLGWELTPPIMVFGSEERLYLSFDDLDADYRVWQYTVIHCDAEWNPTDLWQNEYIEGFTEDYIREYRFSYNTLQMFTNYSLIIPNENFRFNISGNYILKVFPDGEPENPILTRRFMVVEPLVTVEGNVRAANEISKRFTHHEVSFSIYSGAYHISEPERDMKVVVLQNQRWDNALWGIKPMMVRGDEYDFRYNDGTIVFAAGNEFRYFDIKSLRYQSDRVDALENRSDGYHVRLLPDKVKATAPYITESDMNGQRFIKTEDANDPVTESEYVWVDFFLPYASPLTGGGIYIMGALTDWQFFAPGNSPASATGPGRMEYNFARQGYEARLYLKQGYYNYLYVYLPDGKTIAETAPIEGDRYETRNAYTVLVYHREPGSRYDRLIAVKVVDY